MSVLGLAGLDQVLHFAHHARPDPNLCKHPALLQRAIIESEQRLVIVSVWIRAKVVDHEFLGNLETLAKKGVSVTIVFGFGKDRGEREHDEYARESLERLDTQYPNFRLIRHNKVHAKVLVSDRKFAVSTSFNWLSFKGDLNMSLREEEGFCVEGTKFVEEYCQDLLGRLIPEHRLDGNSR
ncbi:phospholipase D-like domain-containing protein [Salinisphaera shabanensis]|uniref:phospholipase D-like domain-containing protein n=1 Tax=Salinisphaera shabanensis TaxID=180542 RepID=UPI001377DA79|nr:phospholipase D-like domain-containing protein [Salinisphaera shabanensis]